MVVDNPDLFADKYRVKSSRLENWDYSTPGFYFITICTYKHNNFLGKIDDGLMNLSDKGEIAKQELLRTFVIRKNILLDEWIIMPNHLHLMIEVLDVNKIDDLDNKRDVLDNKRDALRASLQEVTIKSTQIIPNIIKLFKASVKSKCDKNNLFFGWQSRFYDQIIRNKQQYWTIKKYIQDNIKNWGRDALYASQIKIDL